MEYWRHTALKVSGELALTRPGRCEAGSAQIQSPLPKEKGSERFESSIDLDPYVDAPKEPQAAIEFFDRVLEQKLAEV